MNCKFCGHDDCIKYGLYKTPNGVYQRYRCNKCYRTFVCVDEENEVEQV